ncbi:MAG: DUF2971 domain-containing protein [Deltaproteobacteria bacterium]|nr:DUF2971 domain-containing protein [Deltaproteobacteria bacterium]
MRDDISNKLVHLTKGQNENETIKGFKDNRIQAITTLKDIISKRKLIGNTGYIKGKYKCVCFSEAPISKLSHILAEEKVSFRYQPYGLIFNKKWLYEKGGRPVIYGPTSEYDLLPEDLKYRHVRFELSKEYPVDHTWEREWRIKTDELEFKEIDVSIIVPTRMAKIAFINKFGHKWHYIVLSDLGIKINTLFKNEDDEEELLKKYI